jgi:hypothetical protein
MGGGGLGRTVLVWGGAAIAAAGRPMRGRGGVAMLASQEIFVPAAVFRCFSTHLVSQLLFAFVPAQVSCLVSSVAQCFHTSPRFCDSDGSDLQIEQS